MKKETERVLVKFMADYEAHVNRALTDGHIDPEEAAAAFMGCFIAATPHEVVCNENDDRFQAAIPRGFEFYRLIGTKAMKIAALTMTELDDFHAMVKARWHSRYEREGTSEIHIDFDVIYLFHLGGDRPRIFGYIAGDEEKVLRDHGLVAA
jgi:hypothetical protein